MAGSPDWMGGDSLSKSMNAFDPDQIAYPEKNLSGSPDCVMTKDFDPIELIELPPQFIHFRTSLTKPESRKY